MIYEAVTQKVNIPDDIKKKLRDLEEYDLSFLTNEFTAKALSDGRIFSTEQVYPILKHFGRADLDIAKKLEIEFKKFVAVTLIQPGVTHAPSGPVDMYWHFFILHTKEYRDFCEKIWGEEVPVHEHKYEG